MSLTNQTTQEILDDLFDKGIFAWRQNTTGVPLAKGGFRPSSKKGIPDVIGMTSGPTYALWISFEIKTGKDKLSDEQVGFQTTASRLNALHFVVKSFEDYKNQFEPIWQKIKNS